MLPILKDQPDRLLGEGQHEGFNWKILHNTMGHRCGYVSIPINHPWYKVELYPITVHGGITYVGLDTDDGTLWIGFDCWHGGDGTDPELPNESGYMRPYGTIRTQQYVEEQCRSLCEQAKAAE